MQPVFTLARYPFPAGEISRWRKLTATLPLCITLSSMDNQYADLDTCQDRPEDTEDYGDDHVGRPDRLRHVETAVLLCSMEYDLTSARRDGPAS